MIRSKSVPITLFLTFLFSVIQTQASQKIANDVHNVNRDDPRIEIISYDDTDSLDLALTMPNEFGDHSYNVRFTPEEAPFSVSGLHVLLFDLYGDNGTPGMHVAITRSVNNQPGQELASFEVPNEDLSFTGDQALWNEISFADYGVNPVLFDQVEDFHIVLNVSDNEAGDTLAVFVDMGMFNPTNRSGMYNGQERGWVSLFDLFETGHNFNLRAVVAYGEQDNQPPVVTSPIDDLIIEENSATTFIADLNNVFTDPDGDVLTFTVRGAPELNLEIDRSNSLYLTPEHDFTGSGIGVQVSASDPENESATTQFRVDVTATAVDKEQEAEPSEFSLVSIYPNPFNQQAHIIYNVPNPQSVKVSIYNITGRLEEVILDGFQQTGIRKVTWNAVGYEAGIYLVQISNNREKNSDKILLLK